MVQNSIHELNRLSNELKVLQAERGKRLKARHDLLTYASLIEIPGAPLHPEDPDRPESDSELAAIKPIAPVFGKHHLYWLNCLQKVEEGKLKD